MRFRTVFTEQPERFPPRLREPLFHLRTLWVVECQSWRRPYFKGLGGSFGLDSGPGGKAPGISVLSFPSINGRFAPLLSGAEPRSPAQQVQPHPCFGASPHDP